MIYGEKFKIGVIGKPATLFLLILDSFSCHSIVQTPKYFHYWWFFPLEYNNDFNEQSNATECALNNFRFGRLLNILFAYDKRQNIYHNSNQKNVLFWIYNFYILSICKHWEQQTW